MILTVVNVLRTIGASITGRTFARIVREVINAFGIILAWIEVGAVRDFCFAIFAREAGWTLACVRFDAIDACGIVLTFIFAAVVDVHFTTGSRVTGHAAATESSLFQHSASGIVATRIAVAGVNHEFAVFAMETGFAHTIVLSFGLRLAHSIILTWERVAGVAFR